MPTSSTRCLCPCPRCGLPVCAHCKGQQKEHGCNGVEAQACPEDEGQSTDPPSDLEDCEERVAMDQAALQVAVVLPKVTPGAFPEAGLVRHTRYQTLHAAGGGERRTACGLSFRQDDFMPLDAWPEVIWPLCRRKGCFQ